MRVLKAEAWRAAWRLETDRGTYYLKKTAAAAADLPFLVGFHDHLCQKVPGLVPVVKRDKAGRACLSHAGGHYLLLSGLSGREADYLRPGDLERTAAGLRVFHQAARGYRPEFCPPSRYRYGRLRQVGSALLSDLERYRMLALHDGRAFARAYLSFWANFFPQAGQVEACLGRTDYPVLAARAGSAAEICHHDLAHHNVLIDGGAVRFLDLDYALADTHLHDLANLLNHLLRLFGWDPDPARACLENYYRPGSIPAAEAAVLGVLLLCPLDYWQIGRQYFDERQRWTEDHFLSLLERKCGRYQARIAFLRGFWREHRLPGVPV